MGSNPNGDIISVTTFGPSTPIIFAMLVHWRGVCNVHWAIGFFLILFFFLSFFLSLSHAIWWPYHKTQKIFESSDNEDSCQQYLLTVHLSFFIFSFHPNCYALLFSYCLLTLHSHTPSLLFLLYHSFVLIMIVISHDHNDFTHFLDYINHVWLRRFQSQSRFSSVVTSPHCCNTSECWDKSSSFLRVVRVSIFD